MAEELHLDATDAALDSLFPAHIAPRVRSELTRAFAGETREFSFEWDHRTLRQYAQPLRDDTGHVVSVAGFLYERSARPDGESLQWLYERMNDHMVEIATANRTVMEANRELEAFGYMVAHDLRSPLLLLDSVMSRLGSNASRMDEEAQQELMRGQQTVSRMRRIIEDLLRFSSTGRSGLESEPLDLSAIVTAVVGDLAHSEPNRTVEVEVQPGANVVADPRLMRIAIENLLRNAWKFTRRQAHARIEFGWQRDAAGQRVFHVRDNGAGFDPTRAHKLFHPFERLHPQSEFRGTGVGLSSVQRILARHGGRIWAEGALGRGATFFFTLPGDSGA